MLAPMAEGAASSGVDGMCGYGEAGPGGSEEGAVPGWFVDVVAASGAPRAAAGIKYRNFSLCVCV